jgi:hypothetical protein
MRGIEHVRNSFYDWIGSDEYLQQRRLDVMFIGFQETLDSDFERLKTMLGLPAYLSLPTDEIKAHRNPENLDRALSMRGLFALRRWYRNDIRLWERLRATRPT